MTFNIGGLIKKFFVFLGFTVFSFSIFSSKSEEELKGKVATEEKAYCERQAEGNFSKNEIKDAGTSVSAIRPRPEMQGKGRFYFWCWMCLLSHRRANNLQCLWWQRRV